MSRVAIIDYGSGNLRSAAKAFERAGQETGISCDVAVTAQPETVARAERIVLPGVGAFADCRRGLAAIDGMEAALQEAVLRRGRPFFGICVGMQLMAERGLEFETCAGFGWVPGDVVRIAPTDPQLKVPHMGWNTLTPHSETTHPVLEGLPLGDNGLHAYFVHSYHLKATNAHHVLANTDYAGPITAIVARDTMIGTQFHPEKSQRLGLAMIKNFLRWAP